MRYEFTEEELHDACFEYLDRRRSTFAKLNRETSCIEYADDGSAIIDAEEMQ